MFGTLGGQEIIFILVLALIVFGPRKLPEIGKSIGRMMAEFRKASNDFRRTLEEEVEAEKLRPAEPPAPAATTAPGGTPAYGALPDAPPAEASSTPPDPAPDPSAATSSAAQPDADPERALSPSEPTIARPEPAGVGRPDGRPAD